MFLPNILPSYISINQSLIWRVTQLSSSFRVGFPSSKREIKRLSAMGPLWRWEVSHCLVLSVSNWRCKSVIFWGVCGEVDLFSDDGDHILQCRREATSLGGVFLGQLWLFVEREHILGASHGIYRWKLIINHHLFLLGKMIPCLWARPSHKMTKHSSELSRLPRKIRRQNKSYNIGPVQDEKLQ